MSEPLLDPDCRDGKCGSCVGGPCEHDCHTPRWMLEDAGIGRPRRTPPDDTTAQREPVPTTAPVPADDLRARLSALFRHAPGEERLGDQTPGEIADAVIAELAADPGDLPARMVAAILDAPNPVLGGDTHRQHRYAMGCPVCKGDVPAMVQAVTGVRDEQMVSLAARAEAAEAQVAALQRELAEAKAASDAHMKRAGRLGLDLAETKQAIYDTRMAHIREIHPTQLVIGDCPRCKAFVALDRAMPKRPDDPEEIRRLAQATTESTEEK